MCHRLIGKIENVMNPTTPPSMTKPRSPAPGCHPAQLEPCNILQWGQTDWKRVGDIVYIYMCVCVYIVSIFILFLYVSIYAHHPTEPLEVLGSPFLASPCAPVKHLGAENIGMLVSRVRVGKPTHTMANWKSRFIVTFVANHRPQ